jgi:hypothetical protein
MDCIFEANSIGGSTDTAWRKDGAKPCCPAADRKLMAVPVDKGNTT